MHSATPPRPSFTMATKISLCSRSEIAYPSTRRAFFVRLFLSFPSWSQERTVRYYRPRNSVARKKEKQRERKKERYNEKYLWQWSIKLQQIYTLDGWLLPNFRFLLIGELYYTLRIILKGLPEKLVILKIMNLRCETLALYFNYRWSPVKWDAYIQLCYFLMLMSHGIKIH